MFHSLVAARAIRSSASSTRAPSGEPCTVSQLKISSGRALFAECDVQREDSRADKRHCCSSSFLGASFLFQCLEFSRSRSSGRTPPISLCSHCVLLSSCFVSPPALYILARVVNRRMNWTFPRADKVPCRVSFHLSASSQRSFVVPASPPPLAGQKNRGPDEKEIVSLRCCCRGERT